MINLALFVLLLKADAPEDQALKAAQYTGSYVNSDYGFSVKIPDHLTGVGAAEGAPNHGFVVTLPGGGSLSVNAIYDVVEPESGSSEQRIHARDNQGGTTLGGLPAELERTRRRVGGRWIITKSIHAVRRVDAGSPIDYAITLEATEGELSAAERAFKRMVESFRLLPGH